MIVAASCGGRGGGGGRHLDRRHSPPPVAEATAARVSLKCLWLLVGAPSYATNRPK